MTAKLDWDNINKQKNYIKNTYETDIRLAFKKYYTPLDPIYVKVIFTSERFKSL